MRVFTTKVFARRARKCKVTDDDLIEAVQRAEAGVIDAELGSQLIKQRVARQGEGRSGGFRTVLFYREGDRAIFLHLFEKSRRPNLSTHEEEAYRDLAKQLVDLDEADLAVLVAQRGWKEIAYDQSEEDEDVPK